MSSIEFLRSTGPVALGDSSTGTKARTRRVPARRVRHQNGGFVEFRSSLVYPLSTACGRPEVYIRDRSRKYIPSFPGDLDSLPSIAGSDSLGRCRPDGPSFQLAELELAFLGALNAV